MKDRTLALAIPQAVKRAVAERDSMDGWPCCIYCGRPAPSDALTSFSCAHYISRAHGGLGIEENILTLCPGCHHQYDATPQREEMRGIFRAYLREQYDGWCEANLVYKKEGG